MTRLLNPSYEICNKICKIWAEVVQPWKQALFPIGVITPEEKAKYLSNFPVYQKSMDGIDNGMNNRTFRQARPGRSLRESDSFSNHGKLNRGRTFSGARFSFCVLFLCDLCVGESCLSSPAFPLRPLASAAGGREISLSLEPSPSTPSRPSRA